MTPMEATAASPVARLSFDELAEVARLERAIDGKLEEIYERGGFTYITEHPIRGRVASEIVKRYSEAGWTVQLSLIDGKFMKAQDALSRGEPAMFAIGMQPNWQPVMPLLLATDPTTTH